MAHASSPLWHVGTIPFRINSSPLIDLVKLPPADKAVCASE
jgi:hypothetical protein